jgi:hypothetical protein
MRRSRACLLVSWRCLGGGKKVCGSWQERCGQSMDFMKVGCPDGAPHQERPHLKPYELYIRNFDMHIKRR